MKKEIFTGIMYSLAIVAAVSLFIFQISPSDSVPLHGTLLLNEGMVCVETTGACETDADFHHTPLPYITPGLRNADIQSLHFRFEVPTNVGSKRPLALYFPSFIQAIDLRLNGQELYASGPTDAPPIRHWNKPLIVTFSPQALSPDKNIIDLHLRGHSQEGTALRPFYLGTRAALNTPFQVRLWLSQGVARLSMALMVMSFLSIGPLWLCRRQDTMYGWLALSSLSGIILTAHYSFSAIPIPFSTWSKIWNFSIQTYAFSLFMFASRYLNIRFELVERLYKWTLLASGILLLVTPARLVMDVAGLLQVGTIFCPFVILIYFYLHRHQTTEFRFVTLYFFLSAALSVATHDWILFFTNLPVQPLQLGQFIPTAMIVSTFLLITSQFLQYVRENEDMTASLQETIEHKSQQLKETFQLLANSEKQQAIDEERQRIMLDLHDGVGGQLANTLAYMENQNAGDQTLQTALEDALRDLSLTIDSLEDNDSITTLLGMLRSRYETLIMANGLQFDWRIRGEPQMPITGPAQNLNFLRIAQEAITNIVKHANATTITVIADDSSVTIRDDGCGFIKEHMQIRQGKGLGLSSMRRRAEAIGASLSMTSTTLGTELTLQWP